MKCGAPGRVQLPLLDTRPIGAPVTRADCVDGPRPCQWVSCRHHLWAVQADDKPGRRWTDHDNRHDSVRQHSRVTCALDVAELEPDGMSAERIAALVGVDTRRVLQIEQRALRRVKYALAWVAHRDGDCGRDCEWCQA